MIKIYTDGSCRGNGTTSSSGGWGVVIFRDEDNQYFCEQWAGDYSDNTTNNREELKAMQYAIMLTCLDTYNQKQCHIYSDSAYVVNMCNDWIWTWAKNGWTRSGGKTIENLDLVKNIYNLLTSSMHNFVIKKIKGHAGDIGNELADAIATNNEAKIAKIMEEHKELFPEEPPVDF